MNAAARALAQGLVVANANTRRISLTKTTYFFLVLVLATVLNALVIVYMADANRREFCNLATLQQTRDDLHITWGQLLLEENTWSAPARVDQIAQQNFGMTLPAPQNVIIVKS